MNFFKKIRENMIFVQNSIFIQDKIWKKCDIGNLGNKPIEHLTQLRKMDICIKS